MEGHAPVLVAWAAAGMDRARAKIRPDGKFRHGVGVHARRIRDHDSVLGRGLQIDIADSHAIAGNHAQAWGCRQDGSIDLV